VLCSSNQNELTLTYTRHDAAPALLHMFWAPYWISADRYNEYCTMISMCTILHTPRLGDSAPLLTLEPIDSPGYSTLCPSRVPLVSRLRVKFDESTNLVKVQLVRFGFLCPATVHLAEMTFETCNISTYFKHRSFNLAQNISK